MVFIKVIDLATGFTIEPRPNANRPTAASMRSYEGGREFANHERQLAQTSQVAPNGQLSQQRKYSFSKISVCASENKGKAGILDFFPSL